MSIPFRSQRPIEPNLTMPSAPIFMDRPGKSSLTVSLVLVGSAGLVGCNSNNQAQGTRYEYANREECVLDWGEPNAHPSPIIVMSAVMVAVMCIIVMAIMTNARPRAPKV